MKKCFCLLLLLTLLPGAAFAAEFVDLPKEHYAYEAAQWAIDQGITTGTTPTRFSPDAACNRAQVVSFLWRAAGSPAPGGDAAFTDVQADDYFRDAVHWAVGKGITTGTGGGAFSPYGSVTRAQLVTFLYRNAGSPAAERHGGFTDVAPGAYFAKAVDWAVAEGVTTGTSATTFSPDGKCSRGEVVTFLYRCLGA